MRRTGANKSIGRRQGFVLVLVLIVLGVAAALVMNWMKGVAAQRRHDRQADRRLQADWLAESALARAANRLAANADYKEETWKLSAADLSGSEGGVVEIHVAAVPGDVKRRSVQVTADYPADSPWRERRSKQIVVELAPRTAAK